jgi:CHAD domain-containing protein
MSDQQRTSSEYANHRWILEVSKDSTVRDVAIRTIELRLAAVQHFLPLAASEADQDVEYVHQLRVATRRAVAAIKLYQPLLPRRACKELCRELKRIRRAAGNARDFDVMIQQQERSDDSRRSRELLQDLHDHRRAAQAPLCEVYRTACQEGQLNKLVQQTLSGARPRSRKAKPTRFRRWARRRLRESAKAFFVAEPHQLDDLEQLHEFRIRGKDLRYAMELLAAAFPESFRTELYPLIEQLQDFLGAINDHAVAIGRLRHWRDEASKPKRKKYFRKLIKREKKLLAAALWEFAKWWTPRQSKLVQRQYRQLANGKR